MSDKLTYADIQKRKKPNTKTVPICMEPELGREFQKLSVKKEALENVLEINTSDKATLAELKQVEKRLKELGPIIADSMVDFKFRAVNRNTIDEILNEHPATPAQLREADRLGEEIQWNPDTMPPALVAASLYDPEFTLEDVQDMWKSDEWNQAELISLFEAAMEVNNTRVNVDLKKD